jgi:hypothetical protein
MKGISEWQNEATTMQPWGAEAALWGTDGLQACRLAVLYAGADKWKTVVRQGARWTFEMLALPGIHKAVKAVADPLYERKFLPGDEIMERMTKACFLQPDPPPYFNYPEWHRRLAPSLFPVK